MAGQLFITSARMHIKLDPLAVVNGCPLHSVHETILFVKATHDMDTDTDTRCGGYVDKDPFHSFIGHNFCPGGLPRYSKPTTGAIYGIIFNIQNVIQIIITARGFTGEQRQAPPAAPVTAPSCPPCVLRTNPHPHHHHNRFHLFV